MCAAPCSDDQLVVAIEALNRHGGNKGRAAQELGMTTSALRNRLARAEQRGIGSAGAGNREPVAMAATEVPDLSKRDRIALQDRIRDLEAEIKATHRDELTEQSIRDTIFGLANAAVEPPQWAIEAPKKADTPGIPSVLWSDWHWGEVVKPAQIGNVNEYNVQIAKDRLRALVSKAISLCFSHMVNPNYPGVVVNLGGDMVSGDIHEELSETNELASGPVIIDLVGSLIWALDAMAERFGRVWVVGTPGNHGRMTKRPRFKDRQFTNCDWIIYHLLRMHYDKDRRFSFFIPDGADAYYRIYGHRYLLTHGDNLGVKGGDGLIGALGPILRGDFKTRNSSAMMGRSYDTLLMGHWHQFLPLFPRLIVNGSLKGFDEFAHLALRAPPEPPTQALWFTHDKLGITSAWPLFVEKRGKTWTGEAVTFGMTG